MVEQPINDSPLATVKSPTSVVFESVANGNFSITLPAGANVWTNVGAGLGDVSPWAFQGTEYGFSLAGYRAGPVTNIIEKFSLTSDANASDVGDLTLLRSGMGSGTSSTTYGYTAGGWQGPPGETDRLEKFQFAASSNATDVGNLIREESSGAGCQV